MAAVQIAPASSLEKLALKETLCEPPSKKQKLLRQDESDKNSFMKYEEVVGISESISGVQRHLAASDSNKILELLAKLYPTWEHVFKAVEEPSQLMDSMVLLSYIDCGWPKLFLTQDDLFKERPEHPSQEDSSEHCRSIEATSEQKTPDGKDQTPDEVTTNHHTPHDETTQHHTPDGRTNLHHTLDGVTTQLRVDSARLQLSENLGDVALILNAFYGWRLRDKREKPAWCEKYSLSVCEIKVLGKAFQDLLRLIERETNVDMSWVTTAMEHDIAITEKIRRWSTVLLKKCPSLLYLHSSVPGQEYMNFLTGNVEPHYLNRNFNFDMNTKPPEYVISFPCNVSTAKFRECKYDNLLTIQCDQNLASEMCQSLYPDDIKARQEEKTVKAVVISDIGVAVMKKLMENGQMRINEMENDISVQCGIPFVLVHVQVDLLKIQLHLFVPKKCTKKAQEVAQYHVAVVKVQIESQTVELSPYKGAGRSLSLGAGGLLHGIRYQEEAEKTALIYVNTTHQNRATLYENFDENIMKTMLAVHGVSDEDIVTLRKCKKFPDITLWGSVVFKDSAIRKKCMDNFNGTFQKDGGKFHMEPVKDTKYELYQRFEVKREVVTQVHIFFFSDVAFERAKNFPWQDYWVIEKINFYRSTREANFVFKMPRVDLKKLKEDMWHLCGGLTTNMMNLNHKQVRPDDWSDETLKKVMVQVRGECYINAPAILTKMIDLRRATVHGNDRTLQGYVRWKSTVSKTKAQPLRLETKLSMVPNYDEDFFTLNLTKAGELYSVTLSRDVYKVLQNILNMYTASVLDVVHEANGTVSVLIIVGSIYEAEVLGLMEPEIIYGVDPHLVAMHEAGYCPFLYLCKEQAVAVEVVPEMRQIKVYGIDKDRVLAAQVIRKLLMQAQPGFSADPGLLRTFESLPLHGSGIPDNILKEIFMKWGSKLEALNQLPGCSEVTLDSNMENLQCVGSPVAIQKIKNGLDELCSALTGCEVTLYANQGNCCCACFTDVCEVTNRSYTLEHCGHTYCTDCLITQIKTHISNKALPMLPIKCAKEACGVLMSMLDILTACTKGNIHIHELLDAVYQYHITTNRDYVRHCTTEWCQVVYEVPVEGAWTFNCPACQQTTCIKCATPWHPGLSCVVKTLIDSLDDEHLRAWILADPENRKMCPECRVGIEKNGGCANVLCAGCTRSICWKCMETFKTSNECYVHINKHT